MPVLGQPQQRTQQLPLCDKHQQGFCPLHVQGSSPQGRQWKSLGIGRIAAHPPVAPGQAVLLVERERPVLRGDALQELVPPGILCDALLRLLRRVLLLCAGQAGCSATAADR